MTDFFYYSKSRKEARERRELAKLKSATEKSQAANVILTLFFGPLGLFYADAGAAIGLILLIIMGFIAVFVYAASNSLEAIEALVLLGGYLFLAITIVWILAIILGCVAVSRHNEKVTFLRERREHDRHIEHLEAVEKAGTQTAQSTDARKEYEPQTKPLETPEDGSDRVEEPQPERSQRALQDHQGKSREEIEEELDGSLVVIQAAALTISSSVWPISDASQSEKARMNWESHLQKILDHYPRHLRPNERLLLGTIQDAWNFAERLRSSQTS